MASESLASRIETASCSVDGVASYLMDLVGSPDLQVSRQAYALGDLMERISVDLDGIANEIRKLTDKEA